GPRHAPLAGAAAGLDRRKPERLGPRHGTRATGALDPHEPLGPRPSGRGLGPRGPAAPHAPGLEESGAAPARTPPDRPPPRTQTAAAARVGAYSANARSAAKNAPGARDSVFTSTQPVSKSGSRCRSSEATAPTGVCLLRYRSTVAHRRTSSSVRLWWLLIS